MTIETVEAIFRLGKDAAVAGAAVVGAVVAVGGLDTWRRQLAGNALHEVGRSLLKHSYEVRDAFRHIRGLTIIPPELQDVGAGEGKARSWPDYEIQAYDAAFSELGVKLRELRAALVEAQVLLGTNEEEAMAPFIRLRGRLLAAFRRHFRYAATQRQMSPEEFEGTDALMYDRSGEEPDHFQQQVDGAVKAIEAMARPLLLTGAQRRRILF